MISELEAFRSVNFDWTRQLKSVWWDPAYHVPSLHEAVIDDLISYFKARTRDTCLTGEPLGRVIVGPAGYGKTHLIGELRRRTWSMGSWFILLDFIGIKDFWSSVALGFLNSLQVRMPSGQTQYDSLIIKLAELLELRSDLIVISNKLKDNPGELVRALVNLFVGALSHLHPQDTLQHRDIVTALILLISEDLDYHSVAHAWLQGMSLDAEVVKPLGFKSQNSPIKVIEGLSWIMSLVAPTLIAVDQIDAIVSASSAFARARVSNANQEQLEALSIVEALAEGLMDLHEKKRRAVTVVSCLEATWKVLGISTVSVTDRYLDATALRAMNSLETAQQLVAARLGAAYEACGFTPPYPTWPFNVSAFETAIGMSPRQLLKACEAFRQRCVAEGCVKECLSFDLTMEVKSPAPKPDGFSEAYERELAATTINHLSSADQEEQLRTLLDATLRLFEKHLELPDAIDVEVQRDPDQKRPSLHGRLSFTFHNEGDREQHYCFRILGHTNPIAFQSRLKAAMTASGIDTALKFRHLFILRWGEVPGGAKTKLLVEQFVKAGGKFVRPHDDDLRVFVALQAMARADAPGFDAWLRTRKPLFDTALFQTAGLAPPPFLNAPSTPTNGAASGPKEDNSGPVHGSSDGVHKPGTPPQPKPANLSASESASGPRSIPIGRRYERGKVGDLVSLAADLLPRHVAIFAGPGSGKTVLLRRIVEEAALLGIPAVVLDINNDLSRLGDRWPEYPEGFTTKDVAKAAEFHARSEVVIWTPGAPNGNPISLPLLPDFAGIGDKQDELTEIERNQAVDMALETLSPYVGGAGQKAKLMRGVLANALQFFSKKGSSELDDLIDLLADLPENVSQIGDSYKLAREIADQLRAAVATNPMLRSAGAKLDPNRLFNGVSGKTRVSVINFSGLGEEARQSFVNQLQMSLFSWIKQHPSPSGRLYVLDEAQNFAPSQTQTPCKESVRSLVAQARKYGLGMILATQLPKGIDNGIVSNCTTHVYGRMSSPNTISAIQELMTAKGGAAEDIGRLSKGEFYFSTDGFDRPVKIRTPMCLTWHSTNPPKPEEVIQKASLCK